LSRIGCDYSHALAAGRCTAGFSESSP
jgi:hypothetical protein